MYRDIFRLGFGTATVAVLLAANPLSFASNDAGSDGVDALNTDPVISKLKPAQADGRGYQLVYTINAPIDVTWDFKTDFDSQILLTNKLIKSHRLVRHTGNEVITATVYNDKPKVTFKWQTTLFPGRHLLKFVLLNPEECGQVYHHGSIQLQAVGSGTRVTQEAYFDFFGVSIWVKYPFSGGMSQFLKYTARWEQQAVMKYWHQIEK
ncbi:MAG: hypothetical protein WBS20_15250 [Lysobacterales bacterium]